MGCRNHPGTLETRICPGCNSHWCDACPRRLANRQVCPACGHQVQSYVVVKSLFDSIADAVGRVISIEAVFTAAAIAVPNALVGWGWIWGVLYSAALVSYFFVVIGHVGDGKQGLPGPSDSTFDIMETVSMAWRGMVVNFVGFLPLIIWLIHTAFADPSPFRPELMVVDDGSGELPIEGVRPHGRDAMDAALVLIGLILAGQLYMPAVILAVTVTNSTWAAVYPVAWVQIMSRAPGRYVRFAIVWIGSVMVGAGLVMVTDLLLPPTLIGNYGAGFFWCMFSIAQAALVGNYLRENGSAFGWEPFPALASVVTESPRPAPSPAASPPVQISSGPAPAPDTRYAQTRARRPSRMPSSIPLDGPVSTDLAIDNPGESLNYAIASVRVSQVGFEATRENGVLLSVRWSEVVGVVVRRLPSNISDGTHFIDIVSTPGATLRFVPWTQISGVEIPGSPMYRARKLIELVLERNPQAKLDGGTRAFLQGQEALQIPDTDTLAEHDRRLA